MGIEKCSFVIRHHVSQINHFETLRSDREQFFNGGVGIDPGPLAASMLADMGADVIKIESPGSGDLARNMLPKGRYQQLFVVFNRGQQGVPSI